MAQLRPSRAWQGRLQRWHATKGGYIAAVVPALRKLSARLLKLLFARLLRADKQAGPDTVTAHLTTLHPAFYNQHHSTPPPNTPGALPPPETHPAITS